MVAGAELPPEKFTVPPFALKIPLPEITKALNIFSKLGALNVPPDTEKFDDAIVSVAPAGKLEVPPVCVYENMLSPDGRVTFPPDCV